MYSHVSTTDTRMPLCAERSRIIATRIQFSRQWTWLYSAAIVLNGLLLLWALLETTTALGRSLDPRLKRAIFAGLDSAVTLFVLTEIALNWTTQGRAVFCAQCANHVDVCVAALCLAALMLAVAGPAAELEEEEEAEATVKLLSRRACAKHTRARGRNGIRPQHPATAPGRSTRPQYPAPASSHG
jgi:hypothetical protein